METTKEVSQKTFHFFGEINHDLVENLICTLEKDSVESPGEPFTLVFSSTGGSTSDGIFLHNFLRVIPREITMIASGCVSSAGLYPFLAGDVRVAFQGATFFIHPLTMNLSGSQTIRDVRESLTIMEADDKRTRDCIMERTSIPADDLEDMLNRGRILSVEEAIDCGIIAGTVPIEKKAAAPQT